MVTCLFSVQLPRGTRAANSLDTARTCVREEIGTDNRIHTIPRISWLIVYMGSATGIKETFKIALATAAKLRKGGP